MAEEKILKDEILNDEQLEEVAGGTYEESYSDMIYLNRKCGIGFYPHSREASVNKLGYLYAQAGLRLEANNDCYGNRYYDEKGRLITHEEAFGKLVFAINHGKVKDL